MPKSYLRSAAFGREAVGLGALLVAVLVAGVSIHRHSRLVALIDQIDPAAQRAAVQDALIGRRLAIASLAPHPASVTAAPRIIWVLDLDECSGCLDNIAAWTRLERLETHELALLLIGEATSTDRSRLRLLRRTAVTTVTSAEVSRIFGYVLPSTKLLLDSEGVVVLADSRSQARECGWSFEAQLGTLLGLNEAQAIRPSGPEPSTD